MTTAREVAWMMSLALMAAVAAGSGCASKAPPPPSGFLSDYARLQKQNATVARYISPKLGEYESFMIDPIQVAANNKLAPKDRAEIAKYFNFVFGQELKKRGYRIAAEPDVGVARVRVAMTNASESTWATPIQPGTKLSGAGTGTAMEGEVVDSVTGEQLAAVIQTDRGNWFEVNPYTKLDDVKEAINTWSQNAVARLDELRAAR